ncbi:MAG TPA: FtsH protease activity modulator HflK [Gammaproteobacteria bacterium]|nr:FtsH protease activity modulator HflK [Gammaproteobacteria bacterium]
MSWNEPGHDKDPWGNNHKPADLDELIRNIQHRVQGLFSNKPHGKKSGGSGILWLLPVLVVIWLLTGFYRVDSAEQAVVLRFGAYQTTTGPGLHWHLPWPMARADLVNVARVRSFPYSNEMLTADENIVQVAIAVQYVVDNPYKYLFNVRQPNRTLGEVSEAAIRQVVGKNKMNYILGTGQSEIAAAAKQKMQSILNRYDAGLKVLSVNLQKDQPPREVQDAFDDVNKAREDKQRLQNEAQAYANSVVPKAQGDAAHIVQGAEAYKAQVVAEAQGRTSRFDAILAQYKKAPRVTRERLYIDGVADVLKNTHKIVIDPSARGSLLYMPLDKLFKSKPKPKTESKSTSVAQANGEGAQ